MSVRVMADVWDAGPDDAVDSSVLVALANHCDDDGRSCFPSVERVARMVRRSQRTVERSIAALEAGGWVAVSRGGGRGVFSSYTINVEKLSKRRQAVAELRGEKARPRCPEKATPGHEKATATTEKATATPYYKEEPSWNHHGKDTTPLPPSQARGAVPEMPVPEMPVRVGQAQEDMGSTALTAEQRVDLDEVNRLRARSTPPLGPLDEREWLAVLEAKPMPDALLFDLASRRGRRRRLRDRGPAVRTKPGKNPEKTLRKDFFAPGLH